VFGVERDDGFFPIAGGALPEAGASRLSFAVLRVDLHDADVEQVLDGPPHVGLGGERVDLEGVGVVARRAVHALLGHQRPHDDLVRREIERGLLKHLRDFLIELGVGFAFVGNQYHLEVGGDDFYLDLLFYHLQLRCYVVIELKTGKFKPEYAGQMNFYLSAVDDLLRHPDDQASIGLILCRDKNAIVVEYSLRGQSKPMGVAEYQLTQALPDDLKGKLPTAEQLERELGQEGD
jgi:hypothetical protein